MYGAVQALAGVTDIGTSAGFHVVMDGMLLEPANFEFIA